MMKSKRKMRLSRASVYLMIGSVRLQAELEIDNIIFLRGLWGAKLVTDTC